MNVFFKIVIKTIFLNIITKDTAMSNMYTGSTFGIEIFFNDLRQEE
jgi:hypothetical protein